MERKPFSGIFPIENQEAKPMKPKTEGHTPRPEDIQPWQEIEKLQNINAELLAVLQNLYNEVMIDSGIFERISKLTLEHARKSITKAKGGK